jgi:hypothetical protein
MAQVDPHFWAQMALASLVPFQGPKKSRFSGPTPSNAPRNDIAPHKTITYRAIKTTGTLIVIGISTISLIPAVAGLPSVVDVCDVLIVSTVVDNVLVVTSCCCCSF